jgi:uncharacterized protein (TIGR00369 family)
MSDLDAAIRFYVDALGLRLAMRFGTEWAAIYAGGGLIIGLEPGTSSRQSDGTVSLWTNEPLESTMDTLASRGVAFDGPIVVQDMVQLAFFHDPDGNRLSLTNVPPSTTSVLSDVEGERLPFFEHLGLRWTNIGADGVSVEMEIRDDLRVPAGTLQGGVIATLVDVTAATTAAQGSSGLVATSEMTLHFLAPGRIGPVHATGELLRSRAGGAAVEVRVYDSGNSDRLMAVALAAFQDLAGAARSGQGDPG